MRSNEVSHELFEGRLIMSDYDFSTLSPYDFECLVGDLLTAKLGLRLQRFR